MLAEEAIQDFLKTHSLPVALILPGWMFGPYDAAPTDSGRLVLDFLAGKLPGIIEGGSTVVDARDVAQAMVAAVERGQSGRRYIVAGEFQSIESIVHTLAQISGRPAPKLRIPYPVVLTMAWISETVAKLLKRSTLMTVNGVRTMRAGRALSSERAKGELGITFRPFAETLRDEVEWFQQSHSTFPDGSVQNRTSLSESEHQIS
jgi:dihydroflavonol-4-reductase